MAEFKISRIRYTWKNLWVTSTTYNKDDVVRYGGSSWICIRQHTASTFAADQLFVANINDTDPSPAWSKMTDGYAWRGDWFGPSRLYNPGDIVLQGGTLYLAVASHTSQSTFDVDIAKWIIYASANAWNTDWTQNTRYGIGDVIKYNGIV